MRCGFQYMCSVVASSVVSAGAFAQQPLVRLDMSDAGYTPAALRDLSADGQVILLESTASAPQSVLIRSGVRTNVGGPFVLKRLTADGRAGVGVPSTPALLSQASYWNEQSGWAVLPRQNGTSPNSFSESPVISGDGSTVIANAFYPGGFSQVSVWKRSGSEYQPAEWSTTYPFTDTFSWLPGRRAAVPLRPSRDGSCALNFAYSSFHEAQLYSVTPVTGFDRPVVFPGGGGQAQPWALSGDGRVAYGVFFTQEATPSGTVVHQTGFRWSNDGQVTLLPAYADERYRESSQYDVYDSTSRRGSTTADGSIFVLMDTVYLHGAGQTLSLNAYLTSQGVDLTGWSALNAMLISDDGTVIAGNGTYEFAPGQFRTENWSVAVPTPGASLLVVTVLLPLARRSRRGMP